MTKLNENQIRLLRYMAEHPGHAPAGIKGQSSTMGVLVRRGLIDVRWHLTAEGRKALSG